MSDSSELTVAKEVMKTLIGKGMTYNDVEGVCSKMMSLAYYITTHGVHDQLNRYASTTLAEHEEQAWPNMPDPDEVSERGYS